MIDKLFSHRGDPDGCEGWYQYNKCILKVNIFALNAGEMFDIICVDMNQEQMKFYVNIEDSEPILTINFDIVPRIQ